MRAILYFPALYLAFQVAPNIHKAIESYLISESSSVILSSPEEIFNFTFRLYFALCVILVLSSALYLKTHTLTMRILIPLVPMIITSVVYITYKKIEIAPIIYHNQPVNLSSLNLSYTPILSAISGLLMILAFIYIKHKKSQNESFA